MRPLPATICTTLGAVITVLLFGVGEATALRTYPRPGWQASVGWGFGRGTFEDSSGTRTGYRNGVAPQIRVDRGIGAHFRLGAAYEAWMVELPDEVESAVKYRRILQNLAVAVTIYPGKPDGVTGGIYLRAGGGMGWTGTTRIELVEGEEQTSGVRKDEWGTGFFGSAGYDFWIHRSFSAGVGASFNWFDIGGDIVDRAWFTALAMNLSLHF